MDEIELSLLFTLFHHLPLITNDANNMLSSKTKTSIAATINNSIVDSTISCQRTSILATSTVHDNNDNNKQNQSSFFQPVTSWMIPMSFSRYNRNDRQSDIVSKETTTPFPMLNDNEYLQSSSSMFLLSLDHNI